MLLLICRSTKCFDLYYIYYKHKLFAFTLYVIRSAYFLTKIVMVKLFRKKGNLANDRNFVKIRLKYGKNIRTWLLYKKTLAIGHIIVYMARNNEKKYRMNLRPLDRDQPPTPTTRFEFKGCVKIWCAVDKYSWNIPHGAYVLRAQANAMRIRRWEGVFERDRPVLVAFPHLFVTSRFLPSEGQMSTHDHVTRMTCRTKQRRTLRFERGDRCTASGVYNI